MTENAVVTFDVPQEAAILTPAQRALAQMHALIIDGPDMAQEAANERAAINTKIKQNEEQRLGIIRKIDESKVPVNNLFKPVNDILRQALGIVDTKLIAYNEGVRRERVAEEARIAEAARHAQAEADAKAAKVVADAQAVAKELQDKADAATAAGKSGDAAKFALQAEERVAAAEIKAADIQVAPLLTPAVVLPSAPKLTGTHTATTFSAECTDVLALATFVVANPMFASLLVCNTPALNAQARSLKEAFQFPGCKLVRTQGVRSRAA